MKNKVSVGNAGEYFVAGELERRGYTATITLANVKDFDVLAISKQTNKQFAIQVKTTSGNKKEWKLNKKNESLIGDNIIYFFVYFNELQLPEYHIVPSKIVAEMIKIEHKTWLDTPGKYVKRHKDSSMRTFKDVENLYLNRWEYLC